MTINHGIIHRINDKKEPDPEFLQWMEDALAEENDPERQAKNQKIIREVKRKMVTLGEFAKTYESKQTRNISELTEVSTDLDLQDDEFKTSEGEIVHQKVVEINGENYRVPNSVIAQLKVMIEDNPDLKKFKVNATGTGMNTRYTVIPLI